MSSQGETRHPQEEIQTSVTKQEPLCDWIRIKDTSEVLGEEVKFKVEPLEHGSQLHSQLKTDIAELSQLSKMNPQLECNYEQLEKYADTDWIVCTIQRGDHTDIIFYPKKYEDKTVHYMHQLTPAEFRQDVIKKALIDNSIEKLLGRKRPERTRMIVSQIDVNVRALTNMERMVVNSFPFSGEIGNSNTLPVYAHESTHQTIGISTQSISGHIVTEGIAMRVQEIFSGRNDSISSSIGPKTKSLLQENPELNTFSRTEILKMLRERGGGSKPDQELSYVLGSWIVKGLYGAMPAEKATEVIEYLIKNQSTYAVNEQLAPDGDEKAIINAIYTVYGRNNPDKFQQVKQTIIAQVAQGIAELQ